jgi:hypothetical protein
MPSDDKISSHALVGSGAKARVIPASERWPVAEVNAALSKEGRGSTNPKGRESSGS